MRTSRITQGKFQATTEVSDLNYVLLGLWFRVGGGGLSLGVWGFKFRV